MNCPVCEKSGIPDFRLEPTVCPQCNSDLRAFMLLHELEQEAVPSGGSELPRPSRKRYWLWIAPAILVGFMAGWYVPPGENVRDKSEIKALRDSLAFYKKKPSDIPVDTPAVDSKDPDETLYVIRDGDNLAKIARRFYKDDQQFKRIARDNHIRNAYKIKAGDTLVIKHQSK